MFAKTTEAPYLALLVGGTEADDIHELLSKEFPFTCKRVGRVEDALSKLASRRRFARTRTVVIFGGLPNSKILKGIEKIRVEQAERQQSARMVVCATDGEEVGPFALDCIEAGACDYLVTSALDRVKLEQRLMPAFHSGDPYVAYPAFRSLDGLRALSVFVVTPFAPPAMQDYYSGLKVAFERLGIAEQTADQEPLYTFLLKSIFKQINDSNIVVGNISSYGLAPNANVYLELGYAMATGKKVILVKRKPQLWTWGSPRIRSEHKVGKGSSRVAPSVGDGIPSDIQGIERLEYVNCADLALRLYFGFRHLRGISMRNT